MSKKRQKVLGSIFLNRDGVFQFEKKNCKILEMSLYRFSGYLVHKKIFFPLNPFFEFPALLTTVPILVHSLLCVLNIKGLTGHGDAVLVAVITVFDTCFDCFLFHYLEIIFNDVSGLLRVCSKEKE